MDPSPYGRSRPMTDDTMPGAGETTGLARCHDEDTAFGAASLADTASTGSAG
jgi:hypothetical protein